MERIVELIDREDLLDALAHADWLDTSVKHYNMVTSLVEAARAVSRYEENADFTELREEREEWEWVAKHEAVWAKPGDDWYSSAEQRRKVIERTPEEVAFLRWARRSRRDKP